MAISCKRAIRTRGAVAFAVGILVPVAVGASSLSDRVDSLSNSIDDIEAKVQSTLLFGGSTPVSFSGEARIKMQYHDLGFDAPSFMQADRSYLQSGWEGNENLFRLGMVARAGRNTVLWGKIGLQHTMTGNRSYLTDAGLGPDPLAPSEPGYRPYPYRHDKMHNSVSIHEDMNAGIAVRTLPASFWVKLGNTHWTEASPLTVWKSQPRTFAWEYLPFEVEQPIARYYEYNIAKGIKEGRAAWNKKPFNGINVESINLPWNLYANFVYGTYERYDNFEREYIDFAGDLTYGDGADGRFPFKSHGYGDSYRKVWHGRLAMNKLNLFGGSSDMTLGVNYIGIDYNDDVIYTFKKASEFDSDNPTPPQGLGRYPFSGDYFFPLLMEFRGADSVFYKEPHTLSIDVKGPIIKGKDGDLLSIHADLAINWTDTVWMIDPDKSHTPIERAYNPQFYTERGKSGGLDDIRLAFYTKISYNDFLPMELDLAYIAPNFYSPFSFATPMDAFYAFGSNMVGAGKFIARGEGSPYTQNMAGANLTLNPKLKGYGHLRVKYGQHFNVNDQGRDLLFFPYRLNGSDMYTFFHSSYNRWGNGLVDNSVKGTGNYKGRLGDESFWHMSSFNTNPNVRPVAGPGAGGLRSDFLSMFEGFVPYNSAEEAYFNFFVRQQSPDPEYATRYPANDDEFRNFSGINNHRFSNKLILSISNTLVGYDEFDNPIYELDTVWATHENGQPIEYSTTTSYVPQSRKYTFNLELDAAYDIGRFVGYKRDLFVGGYAGINGVSRGSPTILAFDDKGDNTLLWSLYVRLEPAIALSKNFYLLGLVGYENWRSDKSWMMVSRNNAGLVTGVINPTTARGNYSPDNFVKVPIDYRDVAYGIGFDWDMLARVGLHGRVKWISHEDAGLNQKYEEWRKAGEGMGSGGADLFNPTAVGNNDWSTWVFSLELKTWF